MNNHGMNNAYYYKRTTKSIKNKNNKISIKWFSMDQTFVEEFIEILNSIDFWFYLGYIEDVTTLTILQKEKGKIVFSVKQKEKDPPEDVKFLIGIIESVLPSVISISPYKFVKTVYKFTLDVNLFNNITDKSVSNLS